MNSHSRNGILVMSTLGVGDVLLAQPLLSELRKNVGSERLSVLARKGPPANLVRRMALADDVMEYASGWPRRLQGALRIGMWIRLQRFGAILVTTGMNPYYSGVMALLSGAPVRVGEKKGKVDWAWTTTVPADPDSHVVERNMALGLALGVRANSEPTLLPNEREMAQARRLVDMRTRTVAVIPGSNKHLKFKRWPQQKFVKLIRSLTDAGLNTILMGGPDEDGLGTEIASQLPGANVKDLIGKTDIGTAAALLSSCDLAVGNDGMLLHLSAAVGTPVVAIFGPSDPMLYGPRGAGHIIVKLPLPCSPCYNKLKEGCPERACLTDLSVKTVLDAVWAHRERVRGRAAGIA